MERTLRFGFFPSKKILLLLSVLLCSGIVFIAAHIFGFSTYFSHPKFLEVKEVGIEVGLPLTKEKVEKLLPAIRGQNILTVSSSQIVSALEKENWVGEVNVRKSFPDCIEIKVKTKKPIAIRVKSGVPRYIDERGKEIEKVSPAVQLSEVFPIFSSSVKDEDESWKDFNLGFLLQSLKERLPTGTKISEVSLSSYPIFRVFLTTPQMELIFHHDTWESQLVFLQSFLKQTPSRFAGTRRINLTLPKKAIVSSPNSQ